MAAPHGVGVGGIDRGTGGLQVCKVCGAGVSRGPGLIPAADQGQSSYSIRTLGPQGVWNHGDCGCRVTKRRVWQSRG